MRRNRDCPSEEKKRGPLRSGERGRASTGKHTKGQAQPLRRPSGPEPLVTPNAVQVKVKWKRAWLSKSRPVSVQFDGDALEEAPPDSRLKKTIITAPGRHELTFKPALKPPKTYRLGFKEPGFYTLEIKCRSSSGEFSWSCGVRRGFRIFGPFAISRRKVIRTAILFAAMVLIFAVMVAVSK